jgi:hypothetical protein
VTHEGKQVVGGPEDWIFIKLMYALGGFGVIVVSSKTARIRVAGVEADFLENGFQLKKPFKGRGQFELVAAPGETKIILARVMHEFKAERLRFPPRSLKVQRVG